MSVLHSETIAIHPSLPTPNRPLDHIEIAPLVNPSVAYPEPHVFDAACAALSYVSSSPFLLSFPLWSASPYTPSTDAAQELHVGVVVFGIACPRGRLYR